MPVHHRLRFLTFPMRTSRLCSLWPDMRPLRFRRAPFGRDVAFDPGTFTAYIARQVPELGLDLPSNAIGKDFLPEGALFAKAPSGSGFQVSLYGLAGILLAAEEGLEVNVLGLNVGLDAAVPALKLPAIGRLGLDR